MASKFNEFLTEKKIDPRRLLTASKKIEKFRPEDRAIRLKEHLLRKSEEGYSDEAKKNRTKPRSGRPVTKPALDAAMKGKSLSGPQKTRLLRAVNHLLALRKEDPVELRILF